MWDERAMRQFDRSMTRSEFESAFWGAMQDRGWKVSDLARALRKPRFVVRRWFESDGPNWSLHDIADIARVLDIELVLRFRDRKGEDYFAPHGKVPATETELAFREASRQNKVHSDRLLEALKLLPQEVCNTLFAKWQDEENARLTVSTPERDAEDDRP